MNAYEKTKLSWFVIDGQGSTIMEGVDEVTARMHSMKDPDYSVGWTEGDLPFYNDNGDAIVYENKDILNEEDLGEV